MTVALIALAVGLACATGAIVVLAFKLVGKAETVAARDRAIDRRDAEIADLTSDLQRADDDGKRKEAEIARLRTSIRSLEGHLVATGNLPAVGEHAARELSNPLGASAVDAGADAPRGAAAGGDARRGGR